MSIPIYKRRLRRFFSIVGKHLNFKVSYYQPHPRYTDLFYRNEKGLIKIGDRKQLHNIFDLTERQARQIHYTFNDFISYYSCTGNPFNWERFFKNVNKYLGYEVNGIYYAQVTQSTLTAFQHFILTQFPDEEYLQTINNQDLEFNLTTQ